MSSTHSAVAPEKTELGKKSQYDTHYNPDKLYPIARTSNRAAIGVPNNLPFFGVDVWNHYEVSWLNEHGKPMVAVAVITYGCQTPNIVESKSVKLYFNSFNNTKFKDVATVEATAKKDIEQRVGGEVTVTITLLQDFKPEELFPSFSGENIDGLDVSCNVYLIDSNFLHAEDSMVTETLCTDLLKSNCLVTHQPDWCSVQITYRGKKINREGLLRYIVSFRDQNEFHEQCIERIFMDIMRKCQPEELTVYGRSTRRGGLDINSYRSSKNFTGQVPNFRLCRQ